MMTPFNGPDPGERNTELSKGQEQSVDRRALLRKGIVGFTILQVGAEWTHGQTGGQVGNCGSYDKQGNLILDEECGTKTSDIDCGLPTKKGEPARSADGDCQYKQDARCGQPGAGSGLFYGDMDCLLSLSDQSCGLPQTGGNNEDLDCASYKSGSLQSDDDCHITGFTDKACNLPGTEGGSYVAGDFDCVHTASDQSCAQLAGENQYWSDNACSASDIDCGLAYSKTTVLQDNDCSNTGSDQDCGLPKTGGGVWVDNT